MGQAESSGSSTEARDERAEAQRDEAAGDDLGSVVLGFFSSAHDTGKAVDVDVHQDVRLLPAMSGGSSFAPGDRVEAQFNGKGKSYPATVKKDNGDNTYALEYDDGDKEDAAKAEHIKAMSGPARPPSWPSPTSSRQGAEEMGQAEAERSLGGWRTTAVA